MGALQRAAAVCAAILVACPAAAAPDHAVRVVLKFVKRTDGPGVRFDPASCPACAIIADDGWNADNPRETVVALTVPMARTLELRFDGAATNIRRVILESGDIAFRQAAGALIVPLPPLRDDAITAAEMATHIVEPGMVLRFEHADPARRAGAYATGAFPTTERAAANVLTFAQREVVRQLDLGRRAMAAGPDSIQIMGFDTNDPHGHRDAPPHMHMHLRWPANTGTQIGHYYIGPDGLLTHNIVGVRGLGAAERRFGRGERFVTIGPDGRTAYSHRITAQGALEIAGPDGAICLIAPIASGGGFASGAKVGCPGVADRIIKVEDDLQRGRLTVHTGNVTEVFAYDPDTGTLRAPTEAPPSSPSVFRSPILAMGTSSLPE